jgi:hypothetical protein
MQARRIGVIAARKAGGERGRRHCEEKDGEMDGGRRIREMKVSEEQERHGESETTSQGQQKKKSGPMGVGVPNLEARKGQARW